MTLGVFSKDKLVFDTTAMTDSDNVGAFIRSSDGSLITDHEIIEQEYAGVVVQGLVFKSKLPGVVGNGYTFQIVDSGGPGVVSFTEVAGAIVVELNGNVQTKAQIAALLATSTLTNVSVGSPASGNVAVMVSAATFANGEDSVVHTHLDVYSATADGFGNPITSTGGALDINLKSSDVTFTANVDLNGIYNAGTNANPDNVGIIGANRAGSGLASQILQFTGGGVNADNLAVTNIVAQDVNSFGMVWDSVGGNWDRTPGNSTDGMFVKITNSLTIAGDIADDAIDSGNPIKVGSRSEWGALAAISQTNDRADLISDKYRRVYVNNGSNVAVRNLNVTVGLSEVELKSGVSALDGRRLLMIQNLSNKEIYIGKTGVLATTGLVIAARATMSLDVGQDVAIFALGSIANQDIRVFELA